MEYRTLFQALSGLLEAGAFALLVKRIVQLKNSNGISRYLVHFSILITLSNLLLDFSLSFNLFVSIVKIITLIILEYMMTKYPSKGAKFDDKHSSLFTLIIVAAILSLPVLIYNNLSSFYQSVTIIIDGLLIFCQLLLSKRSQNTSHFNLPFLVLLTASRIFKFLYLGFLAFHLRGPLMWSSWVSAMISNLSTIDFVFLVRSLSGAPDLPL
ncbi:hypothetical protein TRFO_12374 [Tritrichomonas foetus]|uniref:Uncharacterized protein n=1 Tax=Tritrichomonas foetus TaxID=1144522 RepID=A0A1J4L1X6_9EUKA|nr:hypothetical protein TRFO_12374 [Tritrichomonas foetus]|eukprot:OHT17418.1 hypothetical protein TRFO_12374 [Tritrichomonas foetus]